MSGAVGRIVGAGTIVGLVGIGGALAGAAPAFADSAPYELYCPGTPVGNVVLNNTVTSGKLQVSGTTVNLTNWQTKTVMPQQLVAASSALNPSGLQGTATSGVDFTGASPTTINPPTVNINQPWPTPAGDMTLTLPSPPATVGPVTATGSTVTASVDANVKLTITNPPVSLTCHTYPNNAMPSGISQSAPPGSATSIQIDTTSATPGARRRPPRRRRRARPCRRPVPVRASTPWQWVASVRSSWRRCSSSSAERGVRRSRMPTQRDGRRGSRPTATDGRPPLRRRPAGPGRPGSSACGRADDLHDTVEVLVGEARAARQAQSPVEHRRGHRTPHHPGAGEDRLEVQWLPRRTCLDVMSLRARTMISSRVEPKASGSTSTHVNQQLGSPCGSGGMNSMPGTS